MNPKLKKNLYWMSALLVAAILTMTFPQRAAADDVDPPGRAARLNYLGGSVSFEPAGETDWVSAEVNRPMTTGDRLWTDTGARAEMHLGAATIRLDSGTGFSFLNLDDNTTQIQLSEGTLNIRVRRLDRDEFFEVDTPNSAFSILQPGQYRIEVNENGDSTLVTVRAGDGEVTGGGRIYSVHSGEAGQFTGTDSLYADIFRADGLDEFDSWSQDRDRRDDQSRSARYVSRDLVGYEDLDDNGSWRSDPDYGDVWVPRVAVGWAPYRYGYWAWISPWGWTWVDDAPWGYAPFHYGRWAYVRNSWCWVPGPISVRPVYAPALVAFVGGPSFGLLISFGGGRGGGNVGWFPLGPREVYVPAYNASRAYVTRVNVSNTNVNNTTVINVYNSQLTNNGRGNNNGNNRNNQEIRYANRSVPGGVTAVSQSTFTSAQPVGRAVISVNPRDIESAPVNRRAEVVPTRNSVLGNSAPRGNRGPQPSPNVVNRTVVAKTPPPPPPVPFERQQQQLAAHPGQPLASSEVQGLRPANAPAERPLVRQAPPGRPAAADSNQPGRGRGNIQPSNSGPVNSGAVPPVNNAPPGRNNQPDRQGRGQFGNAPPAQPPAAAPAAPPPNPSPAPPVNNGPPARNNRSDRQGRGQFGNAPPAQPPAAAPAAPPANPNPAPPVNNAPPARNNQPDRQGRGQFGNAPPAQPPAAAPAAPPPNANPTPPPNNAPPARNERQGRGQSGNAPPTAAPAPPPANTNRTPPPNNAPPARNNQPDRPARGASPDKPATPSEPARPADQQPKDQKGRGRQQNQDAPQ